MLDTFKTQLLNFLTENTSLDNFEVFYFDDIRNLQEFNSFSNKDIEDAILFLHLSGFIKIKYNDGNCFCLKCTEKGRNFKENEMKNDSIICLIDSKFKSVLLLGFLGGILGSFIGVIVVFIITMIVK